MHPSNKTHPPMASETLADDPSLKTSTVLDIIDDVREEVTSEDMHGASREQVADGTCSRLKRRIEEHAKTPSDQP